MNQCVFILLVVALCASIYCADAHKRVKDSHSRDSRESRDKSPESRHRGKRSDSDSMGDKGDKGDKGDNFVDMCNDEYSDVCMDTDIEDVRLSLDTYGRVEVLHGGEWGSVCDTNFQETNFGCKAVCNQLGHKFGIFIGEGKDCGDVMDDDNPIHLDGVRCSGHECKLAECSHRPIGDVSECCTHERDVWCQCCDNAPNCCNMNICTPPPTTTPAPTSTTTTDPGGIL